MTNYTKYDLSKMLIYWADENNLKIDEFIGLLVREIAHYIGVLVGIRYSDINDPGVEELKISFLEALDKKINQVILNTHELQKNNKNQEGKND